MVGKDQNQESGRYTDTYSAEAMLEAIQEVGGLAGTSEVAAAVGCARDTAYKKLKKMEGEGWVGSRKVGGSLVWQITEETE